MVIKRGTTYIDVGTAAVALPGQTESGDLSLVKNTAQGALIASIDGCGHGEEAAAAARTALGILENHAQEPVISMFVRCHEKLKRTRGVAMSLAYFHFPDNTMTWIGVGNVEGLLVRSLPEPGHERETLLLRSGVVGYRLPPLQATVIQVHHGDTLIFVTDGIDINFDRKHLLSEEPQHLADDICERYAKGTDDGMVLVARYLERVP